jgi:chromosomal replication initiation ATPase DnaA
MGYDLKKIEQKVIEIYQIDKEDLYSGSRQKERSDARSLLCYWAVRELGMNGTELAKRLGLSQPGVVYSVKKGEKIVKEKGYNLIE